MSQIRQEFQNLGVNKVFWLPEDSQRTEPGIKGFIFTKLDDSRGEVSAVMPQKASVRWVGTVLDFKPGEIIVPF